MLLRFTALGLVALAQLCVGAIAAAHPVDSGSTVQARDSVATYRRADNLAGSRKVKLTYYWIAVQPDNDGSDTTIGTCDKKRTWKASRKFADSLVLEGSGRLKDGTFVNLGSCGCTGYMCFDVVDGPLGSNDNPLVPFVSLAANDIKVGTVVYIKEFDGLELPIKGASGQALKHNGCGRVDDESWSFKNNQIDFYAFSEKNYEVLDGKLKKDTVQITENAKCKILNYGTGNVA
ncbi:hypothetical protein IWQ60_007218 [Tieghemiomyces parasiticus]|uniref:Uncharacterized protein n=1 Tax=Tieghemiomyces parasiticus TaxID=78921 RepID=A0A9W7ZYW8_9FUNG|nr:hypothetical protein IWQ60_007218 [Tieghemiomyces parasiticus]